MKSIFQLIFVCLLIMQSPALSSEKGLAVKGVRFFSYSAFTRIVFEIEAASPYVLTKTGDGRTLLFSAYEGRLVLQTRLPAITDGVVNGLEAKEEEGRTVVVIRTAPGAGDVKDFVLRGPDRIVVDIAKGNAPVVPAPPANIPVVIMLDAGHGGRDTGLVTAQGQEKMITLELAQAIKKNLQKDRGLKVLLTREKDQALTPDERAAIANAAEAMVFVSLHTAPGANTRVFIQDPDEELSEQPQRAASRDFLGFERESEQRERVWGRQQAAHAKESGTLGRKLARQFEEQETAEPVQAPMAGLKGVDAAAVMIEVGMEQDRFRAADAVARGIEQHVRENR